MDGHGVSAVLIDAAKDVVFRVPTMSSIWCKCFIKFKRFWPPDNRSSKPIYQLLEAV